MKVCSAEAMKMIKELESQKDQLIRREDENCTVSYKEGEEKVLSGYSYEKTREKIASLDDEIRALRYKINVSNCSTSLGEEFSCSVAEGLVLLAQLRSESLQLEELTRRRQLSRRITANGVLEFTECCYDVASVEADLRALGKRIGRLQVAIDRANLTNEIEV